ncbi:curli minor subunit CsgB, partial [Enterobacter hormaechei]|uniref:curli minor subunit CsgB n=1 Tax=Enterobacter hormaechei TaxID=158836 RepID=UPI000B49EA2A
MKNKTFFSVFTLLGAPGFVIAGDSDLASAEYNFAINELSKASHNQAAIIGQQGSGNNSDVRKGGSKLLSVISQEDGTNRANADQSGTYNLAYIEQTGNGNDASIKQGACGHPAMINQKYSANKANIPNYGTQKTA